MLHYNPQHVSSINMPIFKRTNCIITVSGIITLCKRLYSINLTKDKDRWWAIVNVVMNIRVP